MKRLFKIRKPFKVPDGTLVSPFLNPKDGESGLPFNLPDGFSLAAGTSEPGTRSKLHFMPHASQVTFVTRGVLMVKMKDTEKPRPYMLVVKANEAVITGRNTWPQLINDGRSKCEVLYIVTPPYVFEMSRGKVIYDDSVVLDEDWHQLQDMRWRIPRSVPSLKQRREAERRLRLRAS